MKNTYSVHDSENKLLYFGKDSSLALKIAIEKEETCFLTEYASLSGQTIAKTKEYFGGIMLKEESRKICENKYFM